MAFRDRLVHAWNAFVKQDDRLGPSAWDSSPGVGGWSRPDTRSWSASVDRTTISSIYTRIALDVASYEMHHVRLDDMDRYLEDMDSTLNECLLVNPNVEQGPQALRIDEGLTLCEEGVIAVVPIDMNIDPNLSGAWEPTSLQVGTITEWRADWIKINCWDRSKMKRRDIWMEKRFVAIVHNPLANVMNRPNSTYQRLLKKLSLLDNADELIASGKLDLIIQLPYIVRSETKEQAVKQRMKNIEMQLKGSQYGIAYADATEKITQLNRPVENKIFKEVEWLAEKLYGELGITKEVMNGTADEATMINYYNRTIKPILEAIREEKHRKFLTKTARTQKQAIRYFHNPFKFATLAQLAEIFDKLARNEVATSNELRQEIGWKPSQDPKADQLINSNMPTKDTGVSVPGEGSSDQGGGDGIDQINQAIDKVFSDLGIDENALG